MPPIGHHLRPKAIGLYKTLHRLGVSLCWQPGRQRVHGAGLANRHAARLPGSSVQLHWQAPGNVRAVSARRCPCKRPCPVAGHAPSHALCPTPSRTRRNAHLTDDKEIEAKLALGEFIRKGEQRPSWRWRWAGSEHQRRHNSPRQRLRRCIRSKSTARCGGGECGCGGRTMDDGSNDSLPRYVKDD